MNHDPQLRDRQDKQARASLFGGREREKGICKIKSGEQMDNAG